MYCSLSNGKVGLELAMTQRQRAVVAEWLRRLTRNQFRSAGVGSNPTDREYFLVAAKFFYICIRVGPTQHLLHAQNLYQLLLCSIWSNIRERH